MRIPLVTRPHWHALQELKKTGMNASRAKQLLGAWEKAGVKDPEQLRKLLVSNTLQPLTGALLQVAVDGVICFGGAGGLQGCRVGGCRGGGRVG